MAGRYVNPLPPGSYTQGRTDEGVDLVVKARTAIGAIGSAIVDFVGRYSGFGPYVAYHLTGGSHAGQEVYSAENQQIIVHPGQHLAAGQTIALATGGVIETGFAQRGGSYLPIAQVEGAGYSGGVATPAGRRFRSFLAHLGGGGSGLSFGQLQQLWVQAGGPKAIAPIMAAIALAETGGTGDPNAHALTRKEDSRGPWQINVRAHPQFAHVNLYDPKVNAQAAVSVYHSQGLGAWSTYTSGAYEAYLGGGGTQGSLPVRVRPGGGGEGDAALAAWYDFIPDPLNPFLARGAFDLAKGIFSGTSDLFGAVKAFFEAILWLFNPTNWLRMVEFLAGGGLLVLGLVAILLNFLSKDEMPAGTGPAVQATKVARRAARRTPAVRAVRRRRAERQGRAQERERRQMDELSEARSRGRKREGNRQATKRLQRENRRTQSDEIPF